MAERVADGLRADRADRARRDQQVEDRADQQRADQADRHVALRVLGFLGRGRDRVEADIGEEDRRRGADHADRCPSRSG